MAYDVNVEVPNELIRLGIITHNPLTDKDYTPRTVDYPSDDFNGKSSTTKKVIKYGLAATLIAAAIYGGYKLLSKGKGGMPPISFADLKTKIGTNLEKAKTYVTDFFKKDSFKNITEKAKGLYTNAKNWIMGFFKKAPTPPTP